MCCYLPPPAAAPPPPPRPPASCAPAPRSSGTCGCAAATPAEQGEIFLQVCRYFCRCRYVVSVHEAWRARRSRQPGAAVQPGYPVPARLALHTQ